MKHVELDRSDGRLRLNQKLADAAETPGARLQVDGVGVGEEDGAVAQGHANSETIKIAIAP